MPRPTQLRGCVAYRLVRVTGGCNMIANIQGGMSMISDCCTIIGFICLICVNILGVIAPLDCLG